MRQSKKQGKRKERKKKGRCQHEQQETREKDGMERTQRTRVDGFQQSLSLNTSFVSKRFSRSRSSAGSVCLSRASQRGMNSKDQLFLVAEMMSASSERKKEIKQEKKKLTS